MKAEILALLFLGLTEAYDLCTGPQRFQEAHEVAHEFSAKCKENSFCSSYLYKDFETFQSDGSSNEFPDGNCILRDKYEDFEMSELQDHGSGYRAKFALVLGTSLITVC